MNIGKSMNILDKLRTSLNELDAKHEKYVDKSNPFEFNRELQASCDAFKQRVESFIPKMFGEGTQLCQKYQYQMRLIFFYTRASNLGFVHSRFSQGMVASQELLDLMQEELEFLQDQQGDVTVEPTETASGLKAKVATIHPPRHDISGSYVSFDSGGRQVLQVFIQNIANANAESSQWQTQMQQQVQSLHNEVVNRIDGLGNGDREKAQGLYEEIKSELNKPKPKWKTVMNNTGEFLDSFEKIASPLMKLVGAALGIHSGEK